MLAFIAILKGSYHILYLLIVPLIRTSSKYAFVPLKRNRLARPTGLSRSNLLLQIFRPDTRNKCHIFCYQHPFLHFELYEINSRKPHNIYTWAVSS